MLFPPVPDWDILFFEWKKNWMFCKLYPFFAGKNSCRIFQRLLALKEKLRKQIRSWTCRFLSCLSNGLSRGWKVSVLGKFSKKIFPFAWIISFWKSLRSVYLGDSCLFGLSVWLMLLTFNRISLKLYSLLNLKHYCLYPS